MDPLTLALFGGAALLSAYGQKTAEEANAAAARRNAAIARTMASFARARGEEAAWRTRMAAARRMGAQRAAYGHAGVDVTSGTPAGTISETAMIGELDAQTHRSNAFRQAWGYEQQAVGFDQEAAAHERQAGFAVLGTLLGFTGKVIGARGTPASPSGAPGPWADASGYTWQPDLWRG